MIYLNLLNRIFGPKKPLSREEIDELKSNQASHESEQNAQDDGFNAESMEGWSDIDTDVNSTMRSLDEKMKKHLEDSNPKQNFRNVYIFLGTFSAVMLLLIIYTYQGNQITKETTTQAKVSIEKIESETETSETRDIQSETVEKQIAAIESYTPIQKSEQITKEQLKGEARTTIADQVESEEEESSHQKVDELSPKRHNEIPTKETSSLSYSSVSEVYLNSLKTVDYRLLREEEPIKLLQELPIGTPANQADRDVESNTATETLSKEISYIDYLDETQRLFGKESFKRALRRYLIILDHYPDDVNAHFYSGLCYHNLGEYQKAIVHFDKSYSLTIGNFKEESEWFKAKALLRIDDNKAAKQLLRKIEKEDGFYSEQAAELLNSL